MKNIKLNIAMGLIAIALLHTACADFDDINSNPEATTEVSAALLCTNNVLAVSKFGGDAKAFIAESAYPKYVGYANEGQMGNQYNVVGGGTFGGMTVLPNIDQMVEYGRGTIMANSYHGVAKFLRARLFYGLTMQMGDIPYSETNLGWNGYYTPKYDLQEDVLLGILDELKEADADLSNGVKFTGDPTPYGGDPQKWRRATNAFALRILMSLSEKEGKSKIEIKKRFADIVAQNYLLEPATGYWGLAFSTQNRYPLYSTSNAFTGNTILSSLLVNHLKELSDRRLYYYGEPARQAISDGLSSSDPDAYAGVDVAMVYSEMNLGHTAGRYSIINLRYQLEEVAEPRMLLTYAEQQLILAEAHVRGWITEGTAKEYYESGVKAALTSLKSVVASKYVHGQAMDDGYINNYFTGNAAFAVTTAGQLEQIWLQRYILNFLQDPLTSYFEYRRTGCPEFPINPNTNLNPDPNFKDKIPVRWTYPSGENSNNQGNLEEALNRQFDGNDEVNRLMWILKP